jgi:ParB family transcriptional regulator, chromosome partitioning protein
MGKLDDLRRLAGGNVDDSMGVGRPPRRDEAPSATSSAPPRWQGVAKSRNAAEVPVDRIGPDPDQPREEFDEESLRRLADSLRQRGQLQPIRVRWDEGRGQYVIVCGERRWRAAQLAGLATLSCVVMDGPADAGELLALQLVENCVREDLKPIEQARAFRALMASHGWTVSRVARELAIDHSNVSRALALLELPAAVQEQVEQGALPPATAYEVSKLADPAAQAEVAGRVVAEGLSRAEAIEAVRAASGRSPGGRAKTGAKGRGAAKTPKATSRVFRTAAGPRITVEYRRGLDDDLIRAALAEALGQLVASAGDGSGGAAA